GRRVVGPGLPESGAAGLPRVVLVLPRFAARITRLRNRVPAPQLLAGARLERGDPAACLSVAGAVGDDHLAVGGNRRREESFAAPEFVRLRDHLVPDDFTGVAVDRNHAAVGDVGDDEILPQGDAACPRRVALVLHAG